MQRSKSRREWELNRRVAETWVSSLWLWRIFSVQLTAANLVLLRGIEIDCAVSGS